MTWTLDALDDETTLLTVNQRLAGELRARFDAAQADAGRHVWPSADILPWSAWLRRGYEQLLDTGETSLDLLNPAQEALLWQEVIAQDPDAGPLLRPAAAAQAARATYQLLHDWRLDADVLAERAGDDGRRFLAWRHRFDDVLRRRGLMSGASLPALLQQAFARAVIPPPKRLVHSGFDTLAPAQTALFETLRAHGVTVTEHRPPTRAAIRQRIAADDDEHEIRLAADWARERLQADPRARIGIVCVQIGARRQDLERIFDEVLTTHTYLTQGPRPALFDISLGEPLAQRPLVAHALFALDLLHGDQPLAAIGQLLRSPFVGGHATEWAARALLDAALRADRVPRIDLARLHHRIGQYSPPDRRHCGDLAARLQGLIELQRTLPAMEGPERWAAHLQRALAVLGWPGDQGLDSYEFQTRERLLRLFSEFAALAKVRPRMSLGEALRQLRALAAETLFQAESPATPVRILGPLEAAGIAFDAVWLLGLHDQDWPPAPRPDPLLPAGLQRELGMPHASAEREYAFAARLTTELANAAPRVIASHALRDGDQQRRPSPLIGDWPLAQTPTLAGSPLHPGCTTPRAHDPMPAPQAPPAPPEQRGGAALLGAQAACPFRAFAQYRLAATPLEEPSHAIDGALLGTLVHELLQRVWSVLQDATTLAAHDDAALAARVAPLAAATLDDLGRRRPDLFTPRFKALEAERLTRLVLDWLAVERRREIPFAIAALEQERVVELGGLRLRLRTDRIDRLAGDRLVVIDYKTGREVSNAGWFDARLSEPQLPLYCISDPQRVDAALLGRVRRDAKGCGFVGVSREQGVAPGVDPAHDADQAIAWPALLTRWRAALDALAAEVCAGRADPTPSPAACSYCPFGALCRVQDTGLAEQPSEVADE